MDRAQTLIQEIREALGSEGRPCAPVECLPQVSELEGYLPQLEGAYKVAADSAIAWARGALQQMPAASREACLTHELLTELRRYALMVLQIEHLRARELAELLHTRDALHFALAFQRELVGDVAAEEGLLAKWDSRLRTAYHPRFAAVLQHYRTVLSLDEARWWWYLDLQTVPSSDTDAA